MGRSSTRRIAPAAVCAERPRPWRRRGGRSIRITVIVIEYFRITDQQVTWDDSFAGMLEAGLASAVGLLALEVLSDALSWIKKKAELVFYGL